MRKRQKYIGKVHKQYIDTVSNTKWRQPQLRRHNQLVKKKASKVEVLGKNLQAKSLIQEVVVHTFNLSIQEAEESGPLSSRSAWSTEWVLGYLDLYRETLSGCGK